MTSIHSILADIRIKSLSASIPIWCSGVACREVRQHPLFRLDETRCWRPQRAAFAAHAPINRLSRRGRVPAVLPKCH